MKSTQNIPKYVFVEVAFDKSFEFPHQTFPSDFTPVLISSTAREKQTQQPSKLLAFLNTFPGLLVDLHDFHHLVDGDVGSDHSEQFPANLPGVG